MDGNNNVNVIQAGNNNENVIQAGDTTDTMLEKCLRIHGNLKRSIDANVNWSSKEYKGTNMKRADTLIGDLSGRVLMLESGKAVLKKLNADFKILHRNAINYHLRLMTDWEAIMTDIDSVESAEEREALLKAATRPKSSLDKWLKEMPETLLKTKDARKP